jgi:hypothetical protein
MTTRMATIIRMITHTHTLTTTIMATFTLKSSRHEHD